MPLVFVHGVNVRNNDGYEEAVMARDALFREIALAQWLPNNQEITILNPYWGHKAASPAWNNASLPTGNEERFGPDDEPLLQALLSESQLQLPTETQQVNLAIARHSLQDALDVIGALALEEAAKKKEEKELQELLQVLDQLLDYAEHHASQPPDWLSIAEDDDKLYTMLQTVSKQWTPEHSSNAPPTPEGWERFGDGFWTKFKEAMSRIGNFGGRLGGSLVAKAARGPLHKAVTKFLGDIIVYINRRDLDNPAQDEGIGGEILKELVKANKLRSDEDPLIVVCHSMGGNITYDLLTHYAKDLDLSIDAWVTVGSQVAFFEELKAYKASDPHTPSDATKDRIPKPPQVKHWLNIYDSNDLLSFVAGRVFDDVTDYQYSTGQGLFTSHVTYFKRPSFHRRMGQRLKEILGDRRP